MTALSAQLETSSRANLSRAINSSILDATTTNADETNTTSAATIKEEVFQQSKNRFVSFVRSLGHKKTFTASISKKEREDHVSELDNNQKMETTHHDHDRDLENEMNSTVRDSLEKKRQEGRRPRWHSMSIPL